MADAVQQRDIIVIGGSAGAVDVLRKIVSALPPDFAGSVFVVVHIWPEGKSILPEILSRSGALPALHPRDGDPIEKGKIYVAPPDCHLLVRKGCIRVVHGPKENGHRPAVDPLFRSAAAAYGKRVAGVVLTGNLDDGTSGLMAIKRRGGLAIVQDPAEALFAGMPRSAVEKAGADYTLEVREIPERLTELASIRQQGGDDAPATRDSILESKIAEADMKAIEDDSRPGTPSVFTCPECHGTLWEITDGDLLRFRCRVGHAYTADHLELHQDEWLEISMWTALRSLEESITLLQRCAEGARAKNLSELAERHDEKMRSRQEAANRVREFLLQGEELNRLRAQPGRWKCEQF